MTLQRAAWWLSTLAVAALSVAMTIVTRDAWTHGGTHAGTVMTTLTTATLGVAWSAVVLARR